VFATAIHIKPNLVLAGKADTLMVDSLPCPQLD
jgi:hypothetical protein